MKVSNNIKKAIYNLWVEKQRKRWRAVGEIEKDISQRFVYQFRMPSRFDRNYLEDWFRSSGEVVFEPFSSSFYFQESESLVHFEYVGDSKILMWGDDSAPINEEFLDFLCSDRSFLEFERKYRRNNHDRLREILQAG